MQATTATIIRPHPQPLSQAPRGQPSFASATPSRFSDANKREPPQRSAKGKNRSSTPKAPPSSQLAQEYIESLLNESRSREEPDGQPGPEASSSEENPASLEPFHEQDPEKAPKTPHTKDSSSTADQSADEVAERPDAEVESGRRVPLERGQHSRTYGVMFSTDDAPGSAHEHESRYSTRHGNSQLPTVLNDSDDDADGTQASVRP